MSKPDHTPLLLDRQCIAAAVLFARASLRAIAAADKAPEHSPERALLKRRAQLYSDLGADMTTLAAQEAITQPKEPRHAQD
jgi:hypothetical protein